MSTATGWPVSCAKKRTKVTDRVTLIGKNSLETMIIYYGILKYGAIVNPVFFEESEENLYRIINMVKPKFIFYDSDLQLDTGRYTGEWIRFSDDAQKALHDDFFRLLEKYDPVSAKCIGRKERYRAHRLYLGYHDASQRHSHIAGRLVLYGR